MQQTSDFIGKNIEPYSPLSRTMCLLDTIRAVDTDSFTASVVLSKSSSFAEENGVPAWVGIEYMAQTIAAFAGVKATMHNQPVQIGFLLGSRKYQSDLDTFPFDQEILVTIVELLQDETGLGVFDCKIQIQDKVVACAKLNVFQPRDPIRFIQEQINE